MRTNVIKVSKVREYIKDKGCATSFEVFGELDTEIKKIINKAIYRARENKRSTIQKKDI